jgi:hypothetical protein
MTATMPTGLPTTSASASRLQSSPQPDLVQLRELTRFRASLTDQIGDCKRKVIGILDRVFPEYETLFPMSSSRRHASCWPKR